MATTLPLFDLGAAPTTRQVAERVRAGGAEALVDAVRRADAARYQEVRCRSALNRVEGMPFEWTINPYRGCTHGCHYCYARRYHTQFELGAGDDFASVIFVKTNIVTVLRRELERPSWTRECVALGTATDCYQPIEGHYRLTRRLLETFHAFRTPVGVVTKGPMVVRDLDVLAALTAGAGCSVYISVPCIDEDVSRRLEPGAPPPLQRLRAVRALVAAGVRTGVLMNPIVPGITSKPALLERTVKAIADHGAMFVGCCVMHLEGGARDHYLQWLAREYPHLAAGYAALYPGKYALAPYRRAVGEAVADLRKRYGLERRESRENGRASPTARPARDAKPRMLTLTPR